MSSPKDNTKSSSNIVSGFLYGRGKTLSECSGTDVSSHLPPGSELLGLNLEAENRLYDMDGVFAFTYYAKRPEMYDDVEGKVSRVGHGGGGWNKRVY